MRWWKKDDTIEKMVKEYSMKIFFFKKRAPQFCGKEGYSVLFHQHEEEYICPRYFNINAWILITDMSSSSPSSERIDN